MSIAIVEMKLVSPSYCSQLESENFLESELDALNCRIKRERADETRSYENEDSVRHSHHALSLHRMWTHSSDEMSQLSEIISLACAEI